jgi:S1-C subfamily serine protease
MPVLIPIRRPATAAALAALAALAGCAGSRNGTDVWEQRMMGVLQARKVASSAVDDGRRIGSVPAATYVSARTALLISGDAQVTSRTRADGVTVKATWNAGDGAEERSFASAAALLQQGYFLTAAHCVENLPVRVLILNDAGKLQSAPVRVVWRGRPESGGPDLALIHAPVRGEPGFPLLTSTPHPHSDEVWAGGFGLTRQAQVRGRLLSVGPWRHAPDGARWRDLRHTAPLTSGDSGGPAVDLSGRLLGVHSFVEGWGLRILHRDFILSYQASVVSPDPDWIGRLIARDRKRRRQ